ncbi:MAG: hypothetical protein ACRDN0_25865 [Trebonia sp.]
MSDAELQRRTRISARTLDKIWSADGTFSDANLVNISVALGWRPHYLIHILYREEDENEIFESPLEQAFRSRVLNWMAEIDGKISLMIGNKRSTDNDAGSS